MTHQLPGGARSSHFNMMKGTFYRGCYRWSVRACNSARCSAWSKRLLLPSCEPRRRLAKPEEEFLALAAQVCGAHDCKAIELGTQG